MGIAYVSSTRSPTSFPGSTNNTSTCTINKPAGLASGDVMVAFIESGNVTMTGAGGWTLISTVANAAANMTSSVYYRVAGGAESASWTWTDDSGDATPLCGMISAYRGVDNAAPVNVSASATTAGTTSATTPTATSTAAGWYLWYRAGKTATVTSAGSFTSGSGTARQATNNRGGSTQYYVNLIDSNVDKATGSNAGVSFTSSLTMTGSIERTVVLKSAITNVTGVEAIASLESATVVASVPAADTAGGTDGSVFSVLATDGDTGTLVDLATLRVNAADSALFAESLHVLSGGATLVFDGDVGFSAETATVKLRDGDTGIATEVAFSAINGKLPPGPRIVRILPNA